MQRLLLASLVAGFAVGGAAGTEASGVALLEGKVVLTQRQGDDVLEENTYEANLLTVAAEGAEGSGGKRRLLAVRQLVVGDNASTVVDRLTLNRDLGLQDEEEPPIETKEQRGPLDLFFPPTFFPTFEVPAAGESKTSKQELSILGMAAAEGKFTVTAEAEGARLTISRKLESGTTPGFEFQGDKAHLKDFREEIVLDRDERLVKSYERELTFGVDFDGDEVVLKTAVDLEASDKPVDAGAVPAARKALEAAEAAFEKRGGSRAIAPKVEALEKTTEETPLALLGVAMRSRLEGYRRTFENDPSGRALAKILGQPAPDFTLEDLEGRKIDFRKFTKGKVTLLNFWGLG